MRESLAGEAGRLIDAQHFQLDAVRLVASGLQAFETYIQTCDKTGAVLSQTANLVQGAAVLPLSAEGLAMVQRGQPWSEVAPVEGRPFFIYSAPVEASGKVVGFVQVARSFADQQQMLATVQRALLGGGILVLLLASGAGWALAGAALLPIARISATAQAIDAGRDFTRRGAYQGPNDEVGQLARTFNAMLASLEAAYQQLAQALQAQRRFVSDASHELRTPLTTIRGNLGLLQRRPPMTEADQGEAVAEMVEESERMLRLITGLLDLARSNTGQPLRREPVALSVMVARIVRSLRPVAEGRRIDDSGVGDLVVAADPDALRQVLVILLDNALKHTPPGTPVAISARTAGPLVELAVHDQGAGLAPTVQERIFDRFYRGTALVAGAGLGLPIAKRLVEAMDGSIAVASVPGCGATFTVSLPGTG